MVEKKKTIEQAAVKADAAAEMLISSPVKKFDVAGELARARRRAGMSQSQLAEKSGVSRNTLMGYESGRNKPGVRELKSICEVLRVTPNRVIFGSEEPFAQRSALEELGLSDEDLEGAVIPVMLNMLARDERQAVLTLVHGLLEARHGEDYKTAMKAIQAAMSAIKDAAAPIGDALMQAMDGKTMRRLNEAVEASVQGVVGTGKKSRRR